jgi:hypothetical protein
METIDGAAWRKSSYSGTGGGSCVEAADRDGRILVRDTTDRGGVVLSISPDEWSRFMATLSQSRDPRDLVASRPGASSDSALT